ncbi:MAG: GNAT family N-acetyltransferase [Clostridia bacterium]|nr:GNAT family N-acetyltransferase [Clostridia bacterium]
MIRLEMSPTKDYDKLVEFFIDNHLEYDEEEKENPDYIAAYEVTHGGDMIAAFAISLKEGQLKDGTPCQDYVIDGIAVDKLYRKMHVGEMMVKKAIAKVKDLGGHRIILVARAPEFFKSLGFTPVKNEPDYFDCIDCPQRGNECFPEVLEYILED